MNPDKVVELYQQFISPDDHGAKTCSSTACTTRATASTTAPRAGRCTSFSGRTRCAPRSSWARRRPSAASATATELTGAQELIVCSGYGEAGRNSDPFIGEQVNALARQRADITINNPVGLYIHEFNPSAG